MRIIVCALLLTLLALPAGAEDHVYDLGFAHAGMDLAEFRNGPWDQGRVICSSDDDRPAEVEFFLPKGALRAGVSRCGLYASDDGGRWHLLPKSVAGWPGEVLALFLPDQAGIQRLAQLKLVLPKAAFDDLAQTWDHLFGLPSFRRDQMVRWSSGAADATIIGDDGGHVQAYLVDNSLQSRMNRRLGQMPAQH